jgi:hypothetical protein
MNTYNIRGTAIEIHFTDDEDTEMMVYLPDHNKTYFVSAEGYIRQLEKMNAVNCTEVQEAVYNFLNNL